MQRCMSARIRLSSPTRRLSPDTADWPRALNDLAAPPAQLHVAGILPDPAAPAIAIVGTRFASDDALRFARQLGRDLADAGVVVVSGGAAGIDAAAHAGALERGGRTVAVLATGLVEAYPHQHAPLFERIAQQGALVSESEHKLGGARWSFLRRNRLIAALSASVVVVQAPSRSGALSTARWGRTLGRKVWAVPSSPWDEHGRGCVELLRSGAEICTSAVDLLSVAPARSGVAARRGSKSAKQSKDSDGLEAPVRRVWQKVRRGASHPDAIGAALDMPAAEVQEALLSLVLLGLCRRRSDGCYVSSDS
ncbi:MAG: DNA-processing protein DprA [Polyangiales bacterium]